jgi:hypothetical protein
MGEVGTGNGWSPSEAGTERTGVVGDPSRRVARGMTQEQHRWDQLEARVYRQNVRITSLSRPGATRTNSAPPRGESRARDRRSFREPRQWSPTIVPKLTRYCVSGPGRSQRSRR